MEHEIGKVYVVHNEWIRDPSPNGNMPYKIGITKGTVSDRYYGLGLKMPGEFVCDFAYEFDKDYDKVESTLHELLNESRINGEWFGINGTTLAGIKKICEMAGGKLVTDSIVEVIEASQNFPKELPYTTREDWIKKAKWTVETADCLVELLSGKIENLGKKYKANYIAIASSKRNYFSIHKGSGTKSYMYFRAKSEEREQLKELLEEKGFQFTLMDKKYIIAKSIDKQFVEQHKDIFITIADYVKRSDE
jgi:hypothetical protein